MIDDREPQDESNAEETLTETSEPHEGAVSDEKLDDAAGGWGRYTY